MKKFSTIIEEVQKLSIDEKEELHLLLEKYLVEARRDEIFENHRSSLTENLKFSSSINTLRASLK